MFGLRRSYRPPRKKKCEHFEKVSQVCDQVLSGQIPPSDLGTETLAEEYVMLYLEFEALRTHLGGA
jgi:hypothetical protein